MTTTKTDLDIELRRISSEAAEIARRAEALTSSSAGRRHPGVPESARCALGDLAVSRIRASAGQQ
jgi:hypothetical protein